MEFTLRQVDKDYLVGPDVVQALRGVDLEIGSGERVAITGPSGGGKSTLLSLLGALDRPTRGEVRIGGREVGGLSDAELSRLRGTTMGFIFQAFQLVATLTARENVELPLRYSGTPRSERKARAEAALGEVGLGRRGDHRPVQLSGGEQQRVAIARALVTRPRIVLADEPTGNLDSVRGGEIAELLLGPVAEGRTLVLVTHDPALAGRLPRRILVTDGRALAHDVEPSLASAPWRCA